MKTIVMTLILLIASLFPAPCQAQNTYDITDLGGLGDNFTFPEDMNDRGEVVGYAYTGAEYHAFLYSNGTIHDLGTPSGTGFSSGDAISNSGLIATAGVYVFNHGSWTPLAGMPSYTFVRPFSVNSSGVIVGFTAHDTTTRAFSYHAGTLTDLGALGGSNSEARRINDAGVIVGRAEDGYGHMHAFLYRNGAMADLGTLGGTESIARGINAQGKVVVGGADTAAGSRHAFVCRNGVLTDLGDLGGDYSEAESINERGQIVGVSQGLTTNNRAVMFANGTVIDLNDLVPPGVTGELLEAIGINNAGQIICIGNTPTFSGYRAYLLTPSAQK